MISDLKDLKSLFKLCRAQGITDFKMGELEIKFGDLPQGSHNLSQDSSSPTSENPWANFPQGELTPEQLAFYSAGGRPEDDPLNKEII
jgi:hypothetical protein